MKIITYKFYKTEILNAGLAKDGIEPPVGFMAPSAWEVLASYYKSLNKL